MKEKRKPKLWLWIGIIVVVSLLIGGVIGHYVWKPSEKSIYTGDFDSFLIEDIYNPVAFGSLDNICYQKMSEQPNHQELFSESPHIICYSKFSAGRSNAVACNCYGTNYNLRK